MIRLMLFAGFILLPLPRAFAAPEFLAVEPTSWDETGLYEKFELRADLRANFDNPYDPQQVDLWAEFTAPSGKVWKIWGFYNPSSWAAQWMVRFTPTETGAWRYVLKVRDKEGTAASDAGEFNVRRSRRDGFLKIADNRRYFQYDDGQSFYGVGMWYNDDYNSFNGGAITEAGLDDLKSHGCNLISFYPTPLETMGTGLGRYDQNLAGRLDELFRWCEQRDLHVSWNLVFHSYISEAVWGGGNARYRNNPYRTVVDAKDFFRSEEAWKYQQQLNRYIIARWGYSRSLFLWFIVDEINGSEGWEEGGVEQAEAWCRRMNDYFHEHDPYSRATTGTQSGGIGQWWPGGYRIFDVAAREIYETQGHPMPKGGKPDVVKDHPLRASYLNYARQTAALWSGFEKPALIGECGYDHTYYEPGMPNYLAMYHNALWASLVNGGCTTPFWWAYSPNMADATVTWQLRAFAGFVEDVDFARHRWAPAEVKVSAGDGWAMRSEEATFGWVVNPAAGVANESVTISGFPEGDYEVRLYRTWRGAYLPVIETATAGGTLAFTIPELTPHGGHAQHIGDDVAFVIRPRGAKLRAAQDVATGGPQR